MIRPMNNRPAIADPMVWLLRKRPLNALTLPVPLWPGQLYRHSMAAITDVTDLDGPLPAAASGRVASAIWCGSGACFEPGKPPGNRALTAKFTFSRSLRGARKVAPQTLFRLKC